MYWKKVRFEKRPFPIPGFVGSIPLHVDRVTELRPTYSYRAEQVIWFVGGVVGALLIVRFMDDLTAVLVAPVPRDLQHGRVGPVLAGTRTVVAIAIYTLIGWGLAVLIRLMTTRNRVARDTNGVG